MDGLPCLLPGKARIFRLSLNGEDKEKEENCLFPEGVNFRKKKGYAP